MPLYNYLCQDCGPFDEWGAMADSDNVCACPTCRMPSDRDVATPRLSLMNATLRRALARSETSASEPRVVKKEHLAGCGCALCKVGKKAPSTRRRWAIGH